MKLHSHHLEGIGMNVATEIMDYFNPDVAQPFTNAVHEARQNPEASYHLLQLTAEEVGDPYFLRGIALGMNQAKREQGMKGSL